MQIYIVQLSIYRVQNIEHIENNWQNLLENEEAYSIADSGLRFNIGMEWRDIKKRFELLAFATNWLEPVLKWSDFGFCIGEKINHKH